MLRPLIRSTAGRSMNRGSMPGSSKMSIPVPGSTQGVPVPLYWVIRRPGREAEHSPSSSAKVENAWNNTFSLSCHFMVLRRRQAKRRLSFNTHAHTHARTHTHTHTHTHIVGEYNITCTLIHSICSTVDLSFSVGYV